MSELSLSAARAVLSTMNFCQRIAGWRLEEKAVEKMGMLIYEPNGRL
jgi:hypothetical protein